MKIKDKSSIAEWIITLAAIWLLMAPFVLQYANPRARINDIWAGIIVGLVNLFQHFMPTQKIWFFWIQIVAGVWLMIAPFILNYGNALAKGNDMLFGLLVILVTLWNFGTTTSSSGRHAHT